MQKLTLLLISIYQKTISLDHGIFAKIYGKPLCRFYPTCSQYITNTHNVGGVRDAIIHWQAHNDALFQLWSCPVVAETADGRLNDINKFHVQAEHVHSALTGATGGPVPEGNVGGGTGMICYEFKGGTGTSSRVLPAKFEGYTVAALVQANFGRRFQLMVAGVPIGQHLTVVAGGDITDAGGAIISATGGTASFTANAGAANIVLNEVASYNFGSLTFSGATVTIVENSGTNLAGASGATTLNLTSGGNITDSSGTTLAVSGTATLDAPTFDITLGDNQPGDAIDFGTFVIANAQLLPGMGCLPKDFRSATMTSKGHGRLEVRTLTTSSQLNDFLDWPFLQQVFKLERTVTILNTGKRRHEIVYGITSLAVEQTSPLQLLQMLRSYWHIENSLH